MIFVSMYLQFHIMICFVMVGEFINWILIDNMNNKFSSFFVQNIDFFVQIAYTKSTSRKGLIKWLERQPTSASAWIRI